MNGLENPIVFYPIALLMLLFAILTIKFNNIFYSLLSAIVVFFLAGVLYYILGSEYNAVIQVAIYSVAVPIILGVAIMFTNLKHQSEKKSEASAFRYLMLTVAGIFILALVYLILTSFAIMPIGFNISEQLGGTPIGIISAISSGIFVRYFWAFELVSIILTIIVVGLICINKEAEIKNIEEEVNE